MHDEFERLDTLFWICVLIPQSRHEALDGSDDAIALLGLLAVSCYIIISGIKRDVDEMPILGLRTRRPDCVGPRSDLIEMGGMAIVKSEELLDLSLGRAGEPGFGDLSDNRVAFRPPRLALGAENDCAGAQHCRAAFPVRHRTSPWLARAPYREIQLIG